MKKPARTRNRVTKKRRAKRLKAHAWPRHPQDWYVEPGRVTRQLLAVERFESTTLDPACGGGNIVTSFLDAGLPCLGTDLVRRVDEGTPWFDREFDFMKGDHTGLSGLMFDNIVMNPPFYRAKGAETFIRRAIALAPRKVAAFVETRFLGSEGRANGLFAEFPPTAIWIVTPRPSCPPGDYLEAGNTAESGKSDWCWIVWEKGAARRPLDWLRAEHAVMPVLSVREPSGTLSTGHAPGTETDISVICRAPPPSDAAAPFPGPMLSGTC